eukprot:2739352-Amphidinium_carterae.1
MFFHEQHRYHGHMPTARASSTVHAIAGARTILPCKLTHKRLQLSHQCFQCCIWVSKLSEPGQLGHECLGRESLVDDLEQGPKCPKLSPKLGSHFRPANVIVHNRQSE